MKKRIAALLAGALCLSALAGCGGGNNAQSAGGSDDKTITVGASPTPHAEILNAAKDVLAEAGWTLDVVEFTDYVTPNTALVEGDLDANYFQHKPYLDNFNEEQGTHLVDVVGVHYEPFGLYSTKYTDLSEIPNGAKVAVPNDATNEARALLLLEENGLIELNDDAGVTATKADITSNPKNLEIVEIEAATVPTVIDDVALAGINANYALEGDLIDKALVKETSDSLAAQTYANLLVVKDGNQDKEKIKALAKALTSDEVRDYINGNYSGAVLTVF